MTNPNDPWSARPQGQPTEQFGEPGQYGHQQRPQHTSDPYQAYGSVPPNATQSYPTYETYDPNKPPLNPTQSFPTYQGQQWGGYQGEAPPLEYQQDPGGRPPKKSNVGLWVAVAACVLLLLAVVGAGVLIFNSGGDDSSTTASGTTTRSLPTQQGSKVPSTLPSIELPSGIPNIPGLPDALGGSTIGTITANDGSTLTISAVTGGSVTVRTNGQTQVITLGGGDKVSDLKVNDSVVVQGEKQGDGSILAELIVGTGLPGGFGN